MMGFCQIGQKCAYDHKIRSNNDIEEIKSLKEDVTNLKAEMDAMKDTLNYLVSLRQDRTKLEKDVADIKDQIKVILVESRETVARIKELEDDLEEDTDEETKEESVSPPEKIQETTGADVFKCEKLDFTTTGNIMFKKHMNTKHPKVLDGNRNTNENSDNSENITDDYDDIDLFSLEVVGNDILCVCNLCDTGLDNESELTKHLNKQHGKSLKINKKFDKWTDCKSRDCGTCMECHIDKYQ